ncbi:MAG: hypothetical protein AAF251_00145 [Pseudomonadota bacterium]
MTLRLFVASMLAVSSGGCSTVQDALDFGRGPFDESPASTSEAALKGLHEASWGNSGKWGAKESEEEERESNSVQDDPPNGG